MEKRGRERGGDNLEAKRILWGVGTHKPLGHIWYAGMELGRNRIRQGMEWNSKRNRINFPISLFGCIDGVMQEIAFLCLVRIYELLNGMNGEL